MDVDRNWFDHNRRELVMFLLVALFCIGSAVWQNEQTHTLRQSCRSLVAGNQAFNKVLDQLAQNAQHSTSLTAAQKQQALTTYASIHLQTPSC